MPSRIEEVLQAEQRRAKKIDALVTLLRDPELSDFVAKLIEETPRPTTAPIAHKNGHTPQKFSDGVTAAIRAIGARLPKPFTTHDVVGQLQAEGFKFTRKPMEQVSDSLYFILREDEPKFRVIEKGGAGKLGKYEYVG